MTLRTGHATTPGAHGWARSGHYPPPADTTAVAGDNAAQFRFGVRLAFGRRRPRPTRWREVRNLWRLAADAGDLRAAFYLGTCYDFGYGGSPDPKRAMTYYRRAALRGHKVAQYN